MISFEALVGEGRTAILLNTKTWLCIESFSGPDVREASQPTFDAIHLGGPAKLMLFQMKLGRPTILGDQMVRYKSVKIVTTRSTAPSWAAECERRVVSVDDDLFDASDENFVFSMDSDDDDDDEERFTWCGLDSPELEFFFNEGLRKEAFMYECDTDKYPELLGVLQPDDDQGFFLAGYRTLQGCLRRIEATRDPDAAPRAREVADYLHGFVAQLIERGFELSVEPGRNPACSGFLHRRVDPMPWQRTVLVRTLVSLRKLVLLRRASPVAELRLPERKATAALLGATVPPEMFKLAVSYL